MPIPQPFSARSNIGVSSSFRGGMMAVIASGLVVLGLVFLIQALDGWTGARSLPVVGKLSEMAHWQGDGYLVDSPGLRFDSMYASSGSCSTARTSSMVGRASNGAWGLERIHRSCYWAQLFCSWWAAAGFLVHSNRPKVRQEFIIPGRDSNRRRVLGVLSGLCAFALNLDPQDFGKAKWPVGTLCNSLHRALRGFAGAIPI